MRAVFHEVPDDVDELVERTAEARYAMEFQAEMIAVSIIRGLIRAWGGAAS